MNLPPASDHPPPIAGIPTPLEGKLYVLPPCSLATLRRHMPAIQKLGKLQANSELSMESLDTVISLAHEALKRNYPELTNDQVAEMIGLENLWEVFNGVMDVSGMLRKAKLEEALALAAAPEGGSTPGESTGTPLSPT